MSFKKKGGNPLDGCLGRIEICGGIASGKTTLAALMQTVGYHSVFEDFRLNPFIKSFYSDPEAYSFETEISFLLQHYSQIKTERRFNPSLVCDYSLYLDSAYARVTLRQCHLELFNLLWAAVTGEIDPPNILVFLRCGSKTELERIRNRDRTMEHGISLQYLDAINGALEIVVSEAAQVTNVVEINSEKLDFANDPSVQSQVIELITKTSLGQMGRGLR